ncbi:hypothetical protein L9F63_002144, partial [Diploptera punctata]
LEPPGDLNPPTLMEINHISRAFVSFVHVSLIIFLLLSPCVRASFGVYVHMFVSVCPSFIFAFLSLWAMWTCLVLFFRISLFQSIVCIHWIYFSPLCVRIHASVFVGETFFSMCLYSCEHVCGSYFSIMRLCPCELLCGIPFFHCLLLSMSAYFG